MRLINYKNFIQYFSFLCLGWLTINFAHVPVGLENKVYLANTVSIIEDYDLNTINNVPKESRWIVSETYNFPDMHFDGATVLHFADGILAKAIKPYFPANIRYGLGEDSIYLFAMAVSTITFFLIALNLLKGLMIKKDILSDYILTLFLFSSPVLYWTFSDYSSTDSLCFFISSVLLTFLLKTSFETYSDFLILGSIAGFGLVLKPSFLFYLPLLFLVLVKKKRSYKDFIVFVLPIGVFLICKYINSNLRFGFPTYFSGYEYATYFNLNSFLLFAKNYVTGPFGMIHQAPWLIIVLCLLIAHFKLIKKNSFLTGIFIAIAGKIIYEILCLSNSETEFGFRRYIIDLPFLLYFISVILNDLSTKMKKMLAVLFSLTFIYQIVYWLWYRSIDSMAPSPIGVYKLWEYYPVNFSIAGITQFFARFNAFQLPYAFLIIFILVTINFVFLSIFRNKINYRYFSFSLMLIYTMFTLLNLTHNKSNVEAMKSNNFFSQMVVSNNKNLFLYDEFFSEVGRDLLIAKYTKDMPGFNFSRQLVLNYMDSLNIGIIADPIHFKEINMSHNVKSVYYLNDAITTDSILNYNTKTKFDELLKK
jgi:hypothetical protein